MSCSQLIPGSCGSQTEFYRQEWEKSFEHDRAMGLRKSNEEDDDNEFFRVFKQDEGSNDDELVAEDSIFPIKSEWERLWEEERIRGAKVAGRRGGSSLSLERR